MIEYLAFLSRGVLILVLLAAVFAKLRYHQRFMNNLRESFTIPENLVFPAFAVLVLIEGLLCLGLVIDGGMLNATFAAVTIMFTGMTLTMSVMLLQHKVFKCACFGEPEHNANLGDVLRNGVLILAAFSGIFAEHSAFHISEQLLMILAAIPIAHLIVNFSDLYPLLKWSERQ